MAGLVPAISLLDSGGATRQTGEMSQSAAVMTIVRTTLIAAAVLGYGLAGEALLPALAAEAPPAEQQPASGPSAQQPTPAPTERQPASPTKPSGELKSIRLQQTLDWGSRCRS